MAYTPKIDEKQLVSDLQKPDTSREAFDTLMRTYGEQIYWQIRKMVVRHEDASDLLQNTFLKAWNNLDSFRGTAKLTTWLHKIALNESINFFNKERGRRNVSADEDGCDSYLAEYLVADKYFDGDELKQELHKAIAMLPEKQRIVFNMRYFDDMSYDQISEIMGTSTGALKANYHHAVKKIEVYFENKE